MDSQQEIHSNKAHANIGANSPPIHGKSLSLRRSYFFVCRCCRLHRWRVFGASYIASS